MNAPRLTATWLATLFFFVLAPSGALADNKVALVIGNSKYPEGYGLANPANDAHAVAKALRDLGFVVIEKTDVPSKKAMGDALFEFVEKLNSGTGPAIGLFYYAGHGMQVDGHNYLLPTEESFRAAFEVKTNATRADDVLLAMEEAGASLNVIILDCCRDAPFGRNWSRTAGTASGLSAMSPPQGTLIAFSTKAGAVASDGAGTHSPYTEELLSELQDRPPGGLELKHMFQNVARRVYEKTKQDPGLYLSGSFKEYFLTEGDGKSHAGQSEAESDRGRLERENAKLKAELAAIQDKLNAGKITDGLLDELKRLQQRMEDLEKNRLQPPPLSVADIPPQQPTQPMESIGNEKARLESFIVSFEKSQESDDPATTASFYAARVSNYFGARNVSNRTILEDRRKYIQKYPRRAYDPQSYTVISDDGVTLSVKLTSRFAVSGSKSYSGVSVSYIEIGRRASGYEVLSITQDVDYE